MKKLLILDSNSILNRAFYGIRHLSAKDGTPTNAVYGLLNILLKLMEEQKPDYLCAAFDLSAPTFRHKMYDGYKAQRKPMPDELKVQMPLAKELFSKMNVKILELSGYEADDIIGTVSASCEREGIECLIATGDKDDLQLASGQTKIILTVSRSGVNETTIYDDQAVLERYHVSPREFIDVKALMGDASDNIPGVAGIGEKTAMALIEKHHSVDFIYDHIDEIGLKGAMLEKLKKGREMAYLSKQLATIDRAVPIPFSAEECRLSGSLSEHATSELYDFLKRLDLNSLIKRLALTPKEEPKETVDLFCDAELGMAQSLSEWENWVKKVTDTGECALYFSKTGEIGLAAEKKSVGIDCGRFGEEEVLRVLRPLLEAEAVRKIMFSAKDIMVRFYDRVHFRNICDDVEIGAYLADPAKSAYTVAGLMEDYFGATLTEQGENQLSLFGEGESDLSARKAYAVLRLRDAVRKKLSQMEQLPLYEEIELPLSEVLADMQVRGVRIDREQLSEFGKALGDRIDEITQEIYLLCGEEFNLNSPKQLGVILFEKLGLKAGKKTKTGYSTNAETLEKLLGEHPVIALLLEYRQLSKLKNTYCDGLSAVIDPADGRIHSNFTQTVTVTGRISSTEPNLQNIPVRTELGRELRKMFVADGEDRVLVDADYSQIELRVLAHIAEDERMIEAFLSGEDIHAVTAAQVLGIPQSEVTPEQRSWAKAINFGIVYGIGEYSLAKDLGISVKEARQYIANYLEKYSGVRSYMESIKKRAAEDGYVQTLFHRIRYIPELRSTNFNVRSFGERVALNTPIQGTAADIIKLAMVRVYRRLAKENMQTKLILQIHDELILEAPKEEAEKAARILSEEMESVVQFRVPLTADCHIGRSWYDAK